VQELLSRGAAVNARDIHERTPLSIASINGRQELVQELVSRGAHIDERDEDLMTPLHLAVDFGRQEAAQELLNRGADVNARDKDGWTPLHFAINGNHADVVGLLLEMGANPTIISDKGDTPESLARRMGRESIIGLLNHPPPLKQKLDLRQDRIRFSKPEPDNDMRTICDHFQGFLWSLEMKALDGKQKVWDLIYGDKTNKVSVAKRWIHLPFSNVSLPTSPRRKNFF